MTRHAEYFDWLYENDDPYGYRSRWYESRKRALLLACLPRAEYERGWEIGCSNGELTFDLAKRCRYLLATDGAARAVAMARYRTEQCRNVEIRQARHPQDWPEGQFDLIVFSEIGYFMTMPMLQECIQRMQASLLPTGTLVACHWRRSFKEADLDGEQVHQELGHSLQLHHQHAYRDADFILESWSAQDASVAQVDGLA